MREREKILLVILITISILLAVFVSTNIILKNKVHAVSLTYISGLLSDPTLYCIDHGPEFKTGYYIEDENITQISEDKAFYIANQAVSTRSREDNIISRIIWGLIGENEQKLIDLYNTYSQYSSPDGSDAGWEISLASDTFVDYVSFVDENGNTQTGYGPFTIKYPEKDGKPFALMPNEEASDTSPLFKGVDDTVKVQVNNQAPVSIKDIARDSEGNYYFTKENGIKPGAHNVISVSYEGYKLENITGITERILYPLLNINVAVACPKCNATSQESFEDAFSPDKGIYVIQGVEYTEEELLIRQINSLNHNVVNPGNQPVPPGTQPSPADTNAYAAWLIAWANYENEFNNWNQAYENYEWHMANMSANSSNYYLYSYTINITEPAIGSYGSDRQRLIKYSSVPSFVYFTKNDDLDFWAGKPDIEIDFEKVEPDGSFEPLQGAEFTVEVDGGKIDLNGEKVTQYQFTTIEDKTNFLIKPNEGTKNIRVVFTETKSPKGYKILDKQNIVFNYAWNESQKQWDVTKTYEGEETIKHTTDEIVRERTLCKDIFLVQVANKRVISIDLLKTDNENKPLAGRKFIVTLYNDDELYNTTTTTDGKGNKIITTDSEGKVHLEILQHGRENVNVRLQEVSDQYYLDSDVFTLVFTHQKYTWTKQIQKTGTTNNNASINTNQDNTGFDLKIENIAKFVQLELIKVYKDNPNEVIQYPITFTMELTNATTLSGASTYTRQTDEMSGKINLETIKINKPSQDVVINITEQVPNIDGLNIKDPGLITLRLKHNQAGISVTESKGLNLVSASYNVERNVIEVIVKNDVTIELSGKVWLDGQTGIKPVTPPNGIMDEYTGVEGVTVQLVKTDNNNAVLETKKVNTDYSGSYSFTELKQRIEPAKRFKYYIDFTYDGIKYEATDFAKGNALNSSCAMEIGRESFNAAHATIQKGSIYGYVLDMNNHLLARDEFGRPYVINAKAYNLLHKDNSDVGYFALNNKSINMGLTEKSVDLAALTDIYSAKVTINGKEKIYNYQDLSNYIDSNGNITIENQENDVAYSLDLYLSDYNYRIDDYSIYSINNATHSDIAQNNNLQDGKSKDKDMIEVETTYQILLNNQSATNAKINQIAYYYDPKYVDIKLEEGTPAVLEKVGDVMLPTGELYKKALITFNQSGLTNFNVNSNNPNNQAIVKVVLQLGKDANGALYTGQLKNYVEITSYSTDTSCIDIDSVPDNFLDGYFEDDTDYDTGINVRIDANKIRTISGYVFEDVKDANGRIDGKFDSDRDQKVNDVIVQLIEVKEINNTKLEYIWQETVSGSNFVKYLDVNGKDQGTYSVTNGTGEYHFEGFIPGDYIIRFIYGDNTYYDVSTTESKNNIIKYNGQYYQSTIDSKYNIQDWDMTLYAENESMARDNEARRLTEMGYITTNDIPKIGAENLADTWMCAETSRIKVVVDKEQTEPVFSANLNFGITERTQPEMQLEKHVTLLQVEDNNTTNTISIIKAYVENIRNYSLSTNINLANIINEGQRELNNSYAGVSVRNGLIGKWYVELPKDELHAKDIVIRYGYIVSGDQDYVGKDLYNEIITNHKSYSDVASVVKTAQYTTNSNYEIGQYLGQGYYTGVIDTVNERGMTTNVKIEDYTSTKNEQPVLQPSSVFSLKKQEDKKIIKLDNTEGTERVNVYQSDVMGLTRTGEDRISVIVSTRTDDTLTNNFRYESYVARLIAVNNNGEETHVSITGRPIKLNDIEYVKSYAEKTPTGYITYNDLAPEKYQAVAETVQLTVTTGGVDPQNSTKENRLLNIAIITASSMAVIAVSIVFIKKVVIKNK